MSGQMPPVPPAGRSDKGPGGASVPDRGGDAAAGKPTSDNLAEQDRQENIKQNTTNQGYQQDR
jgi:hypothetical protein